MMMMAAATSANASPALQKVQICIAVRNVRVSRGAGHVEKHPTGWCGRVDCLLVWLPKCVACRSGPPAVVRSGLSDLNEGQKVEYENEPGRQPGQVAAVNIRTL
jgi:hypothetical protein